MAKPYQKFLKQKTNNILYQIHQGFLPKDNTLTKKETLEQVPENKTSYVSKGLDGEHREARRTPFSYKWVYKQLKKDPTLTAYDLLIRAGFKDPELETEIKQDTNKENNVPINN